MLAVNSYPKEYVDHCRAQMAAQLEAYDALVAATGKASAARAAFKEFESRLCNNLVLVLDSYFVHRTRALEGKDGNPANEVRMLCDSIRRDGVVGTDKTIKYNPESSVTHLRIGDAIALDRASFGNLATAFFDEIEKRFT